MKLLFLLLVALSLTRGLDSEAEGEGEEGMRKKRSGGTINDLFTHEETVFRSEEYVKLKDRIKLGIDNVEELFQRVRKRLQKQVESTMERGVNVVPVTTYEKIRNNGGRLPEGVAEKVRRRGVVVVRDTIPREEIETMVADLLKYMYDNGAFPTSGKNQTVYEVYWSKAQMSARQHPRMSAVQKALLQLWHAKEKGVDVDLDRPAMYIDRLRIRPPGDTKFTLPPHVDGGGVERWKDDNYRAVFRRILDGDVDGYDPWEVDHRVVANMNDFGYENGCTFFR